MLNRAPHIAQAISSHGIGASEIAAACGISRYRTRFGLWLEKTGRAAPFAGNLHTRLGQLCEPHARQLYANATGYEVEIPPASVFHPEIPWARCTPDGLILPRSSRMGMQIKCVGLFLGRRFKYELPLEYEAQCQWEMFVCDLDRVDLAVLVGSDELLWERFVLGEAVEPSAIFAASMLEIYTINRSDSDIATLLARATEFRAMVERDEQPAIDASPECATWLNGKAKAVGVAVDAADDPEVAAIVEEFRAAYTGEAKAKDALALAKNRTRDALATRGANRINTPEGPVLWTVDRNGKATLRAPKAWGEET